MSRKSASDGRADDDPEGVPKTAPARAVTITAPVALGIYDVTREEFDIFVRESGRSTEVGCYVWENGVWIDDKNRSWRDPGFRQTSREPVVCVNRADAQAYIQWLNDKLYQGPQTTTSPLGAGYYRLPSWEEIEYAARAGASTAYPWGPEPGRDWANYGQDHCFPCLPARGGKDQWLYTSPVGSFLPNAFGLYDTKGNVWQWTENCVRGSASGLRSDPPEPTERCNSALYGGSWLMNPEYLRVGEYALVSRANRRQDTGFRVARVLHEDFTSSSERPSPTPPLAAPPTATSAAAATTSTTQYLPGRRFRDCPSCPEMIVIPTGSVTMGSPPPAYGWDTRDVPEHRVTIDKVFAVSVYDITRVQYRRFVSEMHPPDGNGCDVINPAGRWIKDPGRSWHDPGFRQSDLDPVVCVSWEDAHAYIRWLNRQIARTAGSEEGDSPYRLLSEAEWEYAARAGTPTPFYWGSEGSHDYANYGLEQCYPCGAAAEGKDRWIHTSPVGSFAPNGFGLYDMLGNVWQWTEDCMHYGYVGATSNGSVWAGGECKLRVLRGGSWLDPARFVTATLRNPWAPDSRNQANGFRIARSLD